MSDGEYVPTKTLVGEASKVAAFWAQRAIELEKQLTAKDAEIAELKDEIKDYAELNKGLLKLVDEAQRRIGELKDGLKLILPMAKGYAPKNQTTMARRACDNFIAQAESLLTPKASANEPMASGKQEEVL